MPYIIRFDVLPDSKTYDRADKAFVGAPTRPGSPFAVARHATDEDGRTILIPYSKSEASRFDFKHDAATLLGDIVARVWDGSGRWIGNPEIIEVAE